ncbi:translocation/assembly module TamB domain-containing protein, partial [bacterium]|nr:translocation/assembly module TamB domain-containing protein [bacterium]
KKMHADLTIENAEFLYPKTEQSIFLTQPLILNARRNGGPINTILKCSIDEYPLEMTGRFTPEASPLYYQVKINGNGKIQNLLDHLGVTGVSVPSLEIETIVESTDHPLPELSIHATSTNIQISKQIFDTVTLIANMDNTMAKAKLNASTGNGNILLTINTPPKPMKEQWENKLLLQNFPLDALKPWLPDHIDLQGIVNGKVIATGEPDNWINAKANGQLKISQPPSNYLPTFNPDSIPTNSIADKSDDPQFIHPLRPIGTINLVLKNHLLTVKSLSLTDPHHQIDLSGSWHITNNTWTSDLHIASTDISPWLTLGKIKGTGTADITGQFTRNTPENSSSGPDSKTSYLETVFGEIDMHVTDLAIGGQAPVSTKLTATIADARFRTDIRELSWNELVISGQAAGDLQLMPSGQQIITASIDDMVWRDNPTRSIEATWQRNDHGQQITMRTYFNDLIAEFSSDTTTGSHWAGHVDFTEFELNILGPFLPLPWNDMTGRITSHIDILQSSNKQSTGKTSSSIAVTTALDNLSITVLDRTITTAGPSRITYETGHIALNNLVLVGDDGSRLATNGTWFLDENPGSNLQLQVSVPDLSQWKFPDSTQNYPGAVSANLFLKGNWPDIIPSGTISATGFSYGNTSIGGIQARFIDTYSSNTTTSGNTSPGTFQLEIEIDELQPGKNGPIISTAGNILCSNWMGPIDQLQMETEINSLIARLGTLEYAADVPVLAQITDGALFLPSFRLKGPDFELDISGTLPLTTPDTLPVPHTYPGLSINLDTALKPFGALSLDIGDLNGNLEILLKVDGMVSSPEISGIATLKNIDWDSPMLPGPIENLDGTVEITRENIVLTGVNARFAGGIIELTGGATLDGLGLNTVNVSLLARNIDMDYTADLQIGGNAELWLRGPWDDLATGGNIMIQEALYTPEFDLIALLTTMPEQRLIIDEDNGDSDDNNTISARAGLPLDFTIITREDARIENSHMNLTLAGRLQVIGTSRMPGILGTITFNRGYIDLLLHEFEIISGTINFTQPYDLNPALDIRSTTPVADDVITLRITGKADKPNMLLSSETGKSHADIMKLLLGRGVESGSDDLATMAENYAKQAMAIAAAEAISARTDLIVVPFPESLEGEDLLFGFGRKFGDRWTVMYYVSEKSNEDDAIEVELQVHPKADIRFRQNQDGSLSGGFRYRETFN